MDKTKRKVADENVGWRHSDSRLEAACELLNNDKF